MAHTLCAALQTIRLGDPDFNAVVVGLGLCV
jgi:hypothetical protein